jgi:hypothetical protein
MILLDTGYFIALFTPDDHLYQRAAAWSLHLNEPLLVTEYVLLVTHSHCAEGPRTPLPARRVSAMVLGQERVTWLPARATLSWTGLPITMVPLVVVEAVDTVEVTLQLYPHITIFDMVICQRQRREECPPPNWPQSCAVRRPFGAQPPGSAASAA